MENEIKARSLNEKAVDAINNGFKYCVRENFEDELIKLSHIQEYPELFIDAVILLCEKEPRTMTITEDRISELIVEDFYAQEEYYSEDWDESLDGCDELLKQLSEKINENISKKKFWFNSTVKL